MIAHKLEVNPIEEILNETFTAKEFCIAKHVRIHPQNIKSFSIRASQGYRKIYKRAPKKQYKNSGVFVYDYDDLPLLEDCWDDFLTENDGLLLLPVNLVWRKRIGT